MNALNILGLFGIISSMVCLILLILSICLKWKKKIIILMVVGLIVFAGIFTTVVIYQEQLQKNATIKAFFDGEGKPIDEILDEFQEKY